MTPRLRRLVATAAIFGIAGCAGNRSASPPSTTVQVGAPPAGAAPAALPALPVSIVEAADRNERRIEQIEVVDQDVRMVVRTLAEEFGMNYQLDPTISGRVTTRLRDVTLQQALDAIVLPLGFSYAVQDNVLRVVPARFNTRIFTLDYMSLARFGTGTTVVQRRLGTTGAVGGSSAGGLGGLGSGGLGSSAGLGGLGAGSGGDIIQSVTIADIWAEIEIALEGLVFGSTTGRALNRPGAATDSLGASQSSGGLDSDRFSGGAGFSGPGAYSRVDGQGRRLIINPIAGTILVSASPEKLSEVEALLDAIQGSVHRQVLIEARIVEVRLDREYQFGINWSELRNIGNLDLRISTAATGAQLTLGGDGGDEQIGVVLDALETQGEVNVLSAPRVSVLNNQRATINVATDEVFFAVTRQPVLGPNGATIGFNTEILPQQIAVGIVLDVHPQISVDNTITMNVRPVITDVVEVREIRLEDGTQASAPVIDRRETDTVVRVRGGETIVIGGLMRTAKTTRREGVPVLSRIPLLGRLFGGYSEGLDKRELVIFITPTIVAGQPPLAR